MKRKLKPEITKPYRVRLQVDNKPMVEPQKMTWIVITADPRYSFTFSTGTYWQAMRLWRTQCQGSEIVKMYSKEWYV